MAPFFKSSSLFNISRHRRKEPKSLNTFVSSPPTLHSRSLPNMKGLHGISTRFLEEFHPVLPRPAIFTSSALSENSAPSERIPPNLVDQSTLSPMAILSAESDSPKLDEPTTLAVPFGGPESISPSATALPQLDEQSAPRASLACDLENNIIEQDENDLPKLDEQSAPRLEPSSTFKLISPLENSSTELDEESIPLVSDFNGLRSVSDSTKLDEKTTLSEPEPSFELVPSSKSNLGEPGGELASQADDLTSSLEPTNCGSHNSPVEQDATSEESLAAADASKSFTGLPAITGLNPSKSTRTSQPNTVKTASVREYESANFLKELDNFAVFFGVERPSKTTSTPSFAIESKLSCRSKSDVSSLPTASDSGHKDDTPSSPICGHSEILESYKRDIGSLNQIKASLEKSLDDANEKYSKLWEEREMLAEEFNQIQSNFYAERTMNAKLNRLLNSMRFDHLRILGSQDYEMNQLKRFIAAMVDLKLHTPVLFRAAQSVCNSQPTDASLIAAIKEAATIPDSPWANILPAIVGERPNEIYLDAIKRCAKLEGNLHQANKKRLFWKMKAQMDPRHAKSVTPSSSSMSLVLNACFPKEALELNCIDNLLAKLKTGKVPRRSQSPTSSPMIAGSSKFQGAYVAPPSPTHISEEPSEDVTSKVPVTLSPVLIPEDSSEDVPHETPVAPLPTLIPRETDKDVLYEVPVTSSPILISDKLNKNVPYEAHILIPEEPIEDAPYESIATPQMEFSPVKMPSPVLSGRSSFICEAPARVIRHYVPGRALFGEDGFGIASGLFDSDEHEDLPESHVFSHSDSPCPGLTESISVSMVRNYVIDHIEYVSYSQESLGLEYIDEIPVDGRANPVLHDDSDDALSSGIHEETLVPEPSASEITEVSEPLKDEVETTKLPNSTSKGSFSSLKRLSASSSKLKQSISSGLKRLRRQITFAPNKAEPAEKSASATSRHTTFQAHHRMPPAPGKENRAPNSKLWSTTAPRQRSSIPPKGVRRPTVSSALKTVQIPPLTKPSSTAQEQQNHVIFESPVSSNTPARKRAPLSNIPVHSNSQKASTNAPRKVLDQGRRAARTLARLIS
ncbi:hypothetical protein AX14_005876 [Amanita brunnescens Koide BX004]|nr:hypothetical protein AX14_005876 [Amanita brunnescens Koide BX004]